MFNRESSISLKHDLPAGLVVFLVALPLCLGIALASGAPLFSGVIAGVVGGIVVSLISQSALGVSGPAAGLAVIVFAAIQRLGSFDAFLCATIVAGILQIVLGLVKAGVIAYYFPSSVIKGMLAAIGVILILKQIPHALGFDFNYEGDEDFLEITGSNTFADIVLAFKNPEKGAVIISVFSLLLMLTWNWLSDRIKFFKVVPGALMVVASGIILNEFFIHSFPVLALTTDHLVNIPSLKSAQDFKENFSAPDLVHFTNPAVYSIAVVLALVASLETLLSVEAVDKLDPLKRTTPTNRELVAQGVGNITSAALGGLPITQVIVRSSANVQSGGKTKWAAFFHGVLLVLLVLLAPGLLNKIPLSSLSIVLLFVGFKLTTPELYRKTYKLGKAQFLPFIITIVAIVATDLLKGITVGSGVAIFFLLKNNYNLSYYLHKIPGETRDKVVIQLAEDVSFLNKANILMTLNSVPKGSQVVIDAAGTYHMDYDILEIIEDFKKASPERNIDVSFIGLDKFRTYYNKH